MGNRDSSIDDPRRSLLLSMLACGMYVLGNPLRPFGDLRAELLGRAPRLEDGRSIFAMTGQVTLNAQPCLHGYLYQYQGQG